MASFKFFFFAAVALIVVAQVFAFPGEQNGPAGEVQREKKDVLLGYGVYPSYYPGYYRGLYSPYSYYY